MPEDLLGKALKARRAVMELCQAIERKDLQQASLGASPADQIAVRDQLIAELVEVLGSILSFIGDDDPTVGHIVAKARHTLDNVRDALPKAGE